MPKVSAFDWSMVFGIPVCMCLVFFICILMWSTNGEE